VLLTALYELSQRQSSTKIPSMYGTVKIRWLIPIDQNGKLRGSFIDLKGEEKNEQRGKSLVVPDLVRSSGIKPKLLADNGEYVLGLSKDGSLGGDKTAKRHREFKELVHVCAVETKEPVVAAVDRFLMSFQPWDLPQDLDAADNYTFQVTGENGSVIPADANANLTGIQDFWAAHTASDDRPIMNCLVTGRAVPVEQRIPGKIKGVPGGQSSGTALVSANSSAFCAYGLENSLTSPISRDAAEGFTNSLNSLIASKANRVYLGSILCVFWTKYGINIPVYDLLAEDQSTDVKNLINSCLSGNPEFVNDDEFYLLNLSGSGGRTVVRNFITESIPALQRNLSRWFAAMLITDEFGGYAEKPYFSVKRFFAATFRDPTKELNAYGGIFFNVALNGGTLPLDLLAQVLARARIEKSFSHTRSALIKLILVTGKHIKIDMIELQEPQFESEIDNFSYNWGRLFAQMENVQRAALPNINSTVTDKFFAAAMVNPGRVFGQLVRYSQAHLRKLRVSKPEVYISLQRQVEEIVEILPTEIPIRLSTKQQGIFAMGYYQQRAANRKAAIEMKARKKAAADAITKR
jgi:CRISPR-associated protein Csd1